jgi:multicomponent Na+:H+ antiporter subunit E
VFRLISLILVLAATWLLLSGHYEPLILVFGLVSILLATFIVRRMAVVDIEGHPIQILLQAMPYWFWLGIEVFKANLEVAKRILSPELDISPCIVTVEASQPSELGQVIYANSITLTPGTISLRVYDGKIEVHALTEGAAEELRAGEMDRRVSAIEKRG